MPFIQLVLKLEITTGKLSAAETLPPYLVVAVIPV